MDSTFNGGQGLHVWCSLFLTQKNCQSFGCCFYQCPSSAFLRGQVCVWIVNVNALCPAHLQRSAFLAREWDRWVDGWVGVCRSSVLSRVSSSIDVDLARSLPHASWQDLPPNPDGDGNGHVRNEPVHVNHRGKCHDFSPAWWQTGFYKSCGIFVHCAPGCEFASLHLASWQLFNYVKAEVVIVVGINFTCIELQECIINSKSSNSCFN